MQFIRLFHLCRNAAQSLRGSLARSSGCPYNLVVVEDNEGMATVCY